MIEVHPRPLPVGKNTLGMLLDDICNEAGIEKKTNHSLRATGATAICLLLDLPEKMIKEVTGSSKALEIYERPTVDQRKELAKLMFSMIMQ